MSKHSHKRKLVYDEVFVNDLKAELEDLKVTTNSIVRSSLLKDSYIQDLQEKLTSSPSQDLLAQRDISVKLDKLEDKIDVLLNFVVSILR